MFFFVAASLFWVGAQGIGESEEVSYKRKGRDPFSPLITENGQLIQGFDESGLDLYLEGIIWDPQGDSIVMISGRILRKGDVIGDYEISRIEQEGVTLQSQSEEGSRFLEIEKNF